MGQARCEYANIDTMALIHDLTMTYQDEMHRPRWPYKFKIKASGCPNDCVAAIARADFTIIGTWRDSLRIDQDAVREYVNDGIDIRSLVVGKCPTEALEWDEKGGNLVLNAEDCVRCMHCINMMPKALRPGLHLKRTDFSARCEARALPEVYATLETLWKPGRVPGQTGQEH